MTLEEQNREARARRQLAKLNDYRLAKTPARSSLRKWYGVGYQIINCQNTVVAGCGSREYMMCLEEVEEFIAERKWRRRSDERINLDVSPDFASVIR